MSYGAKIWNPSGITRLDNGDRMNRVIAVFSVAADSSGSKQVSGFHDSRGTAFAIPQANSDGQPPHKVTTSGDTVYYEPISQDGHIGASASYIIVVHTE